MNVSLILSAGVGIRFGSEIPKQYQELLGKEVIAYSVEAMKRSALTDRILIAARPCDVARLEKDYGVRCVEGGATRNGSIRQALEHIKAAWPGCKNIFINEAVRPLLTAGLIDRYYEYLGEYDAVITAQPITDSLGREGEAVTNRDEYYLVQAPEAFRFDLLERHFSADSSITATVQQLPPGSHIKKYFDYKHNVKITYHADLLFAEQLIRRDCEWGGWTSTATE